MANATGTAYMARKANKKCWIVLKGDKGSFDGVTTITITDNHSGTWDPQLDKTGVHPYDSSTDLYLIHAKCKNEPHALSKRKSKVPPFTDLPPDTGTLTITLNGGPPTDPVPVVYADDATP